MHLDPKTFGNSRAAINLADILNKCDDSVRVSKVCRFVNRYSHLLLHTSYIEDETLRGFTYLAIRKHWQAYDEIKEGELVLFDHARNVLVARYRELKKDAETARRHKTDRLNKRITKDSQTSLS